LRAYYPLEELLYGETTSIGKIEPVTKELVQREMEKVERGLAGCLLDVAGA
jgi:hypothetical protein